MSTDAGASTSTSSDGAKNTAARLGLAPLGPLNVGSSSNSNSETATTATTGAVGANTSGTWRVDSNITPEMKICFPLLLGCYRVQS